MSLLKTGLAAAGRPEALSERLQAVGPEAVAVLAERTVAEPLVLRVLSSLPVSRSWAEWKDRLKREAQQERSSAETGLMASAGLCKNRECTAPLLWLLGKLRADPRDYLRNAVCGLLIAGGCEDDRIRADLEPRIESSVFGLNASLLLLVIDPSNRAANAILDPILQSAVTGSVYPPLNNRSDSRWALNYVAGRLGDVGPRCAPVAARVRAAVKAGSGRLGFLASAGIAGNLYRGDSNPELLLALLDDALTNGVAGPPGARELQLCEFVGLFGHIREVREKVRAPLLAMTALPPEMGSMRQAALAAIGEPNAAGPKQ